MPYKIFAVSPIRLTSLPTEGPGTSARIRCIPWPSPALMGRMAITNTSTPMPPTQWVKLRQNSTPRPRGSISVRMLAPVVVKPETVSKKASTKLGISPEITKGRAPKTDISTQARATTAKPSRAYKLDRLGARRPSTRPMRAVSRAGIRKGIAASP